VKSKGRSGKGGVIQRKKRGGGVGSSRDLDKKKTKGHVRERKKFLRPKKPRNQRTKEEKGGKKGKPAADGQGEGREQGGTPCSEKKEKTKKLRKKNIGRKRKKRP